MFDFPDDPRHEYPTDTNLIDLGEIDLSSAIRLLDESIGQAHLRHHHAEDSVADTAFSLTNARSSTLDLMAFAAERIHARFEGTDRIEPKLLGFVLAPFPYERVLPDRAAAVEVIQMFERSNDEELKAYLESTWGKEGFWQKLRRGV